MIEIKRVDVPGEECILVTISDGNHRNTSGVCFMYSQDTTFTFKDSQHYIPSKRETKYWKF